ncbi:dephospho-CoA kinase [Actinophytocola algeriensis]|uniref:Dephospho-CoA kinase n=1 Tax=Actinophytocola algeriensis TaxID=1768010 RepID=A0A7W7QFA5_9PSEU|nr:dephospho-CoA kinase [Actinophytocola algeriensis]MBB4912468.1 dephospho-CoA kinase [Actinophytocola algeriensis]MBE1480959.1 dephospho-CoA kinase [Actinophytocola algeriensis]
MLRVGLTGGIGSGKSTVAGRLAEHGAVVIDADKIAREVVEPGTDGLDAIRAAFGDDVISAGGLDRAKLAQRVFTDETARVTLNGIVHPRIGARTAELMAAAPQDGIVVHDVPLLVENHLAPAYHLVLVVDAPEEERVHRVVRDRGMSEQDARARIKAQATEEARRAAADVWLDNGGSPDEVLAVVDALWADRLVRYEANVRLHRRAKVGTPRLADPDPTWPAQADRLRARIAMAAGDLARRVDHIGSTSVPGLPAKDVIDLQITVAALADADALADNLAAAGFPKLAWVDHDNPKPYAPDVEQWRKRYHAAADPGRHANVHLRVEGSPGWRYALLFPDWLRANPAERDAYLATKKDLAARFATDDDTDNYAEAKETWFDAAGSRAEEWAERTGWQPTP